MEIIKSGPQNNQDSSWYAPQRWEVKVLGNAPEDDEQKPGGDDEQKPGGDDEQKPGGDDGQKPGGDDEQKPGGDDGQKPGGDNNGKPDDSQGSSGSDQDAAKTGDFSGMMPVAAAGIAMMVSAAAIICVLRRRIGR